MANYELRIDTQELKKALDVLSTVVNKKMARPILADACIRFDRNRKLFSIEATNTEQHLRLECWTPDEKAQNGERPWMFLDRDEKQQPLDAFCISVADYREVFATLPAQPATCYLKLDETGSGSIRVNYGKGEFTMSVEPAREFPVMPQVVEKDGEQRDGVSPIVKFSIETNRLLPAISSARVCSDNSELRPMMNTVVVDCFFDKAVVVASDGHSLFKKTLDTGMGWLKYGCFPADQSAKLLIPTQAITPLMKAMGASQSFTMAADSQRIRFESSDGIVRLTTITIEGNYPNYDSVIPKGASHTLIVDRMELNATLRRISWFSAEASNLCILRRDDEHVVLNANDEGFGRNADEQVSIINAESTTLPDQFKIGFKISTMQQLLGCISSDNVQLEMSDPRRAMLLKEDMQVSSLTLLIMPMLVE